jgi:GNAT superfamily N-acetyltransferase
MSRHIWGGNDYMPLVWDRWLAEKTGALLTATVDGRPVGTTKVTLLSPGEVWLEGLRLHPDYHGLGLSKHIHKATFREASRLNPRTVRYATWIGNEASRRIAEKNGFWQIARAGWMWGKAGTKSTIRARRATLADLDAVVRFVHGSRCYESMGGVAGVGWTFPQLSRRRIRSLVKKGRVLLLPGKGAPRAVAAYDMGKIDDDVCLGFVDGPDDDVRALARDVLRAAAGTGREKASAMLPMGRIVELVHSAGFDEWQPVKAVVYELGARGISKSDEPLESLLKRTLVANESALMDLLANFLVERAPAHLSAENVRDFVARNILPDADRQLVQITRKTFNSLRGETLHTIMRGVVDHLQLRHGLAADTMTATKRGITVKHRGKRLASLRATASALELTLGPGFGACFPPDIALTAAEVQVDKDTLDRTSGRAESLKLVLTKEAHIKGAAKAIDVIMRSAGGRAPGR